MIPSKIELAVFYCHRHSQAVKNLFGKLNGSETPKVRKAALPCSGKLEVSHLLKALESGADGAAVVGCPEGECQYLAGSTRAKGRVRHAQRILKEIGLEEDRVQRFVLKNSQEETAGEFASWVERIRVLGAIRGGFGRPSSELPKGIDPCLRSTT